MCIKVVGRLLLNFVEKLIFEGSMLIGISDALLNSHRLCRMYTSFYEVVANSQSTDMSKKCNILIMMDSVKTSSFSFSGHKCAFSCA